MNWITNYVRPRLRALVGRRADIPADLWHQCPACERMIFHRDLDANRRVCPHCDHHFRVGPEFRFRHLFGESWEELDLPETPDDPLRFRDLERYTDRLKKARAKTGLRDAIRAAFGTVGRSPAVVAVMDFAFMGGSMGTAVGAGFVAAAREAVRRRAAFVVFTASGGARMQEGVLSLMQMARTTAAVQEVKEAGLPYIVVLTDPTTGGVSASFAMLGDVHIAEPGATIGFAGRRVIEQTIRETLPEGFQTAEYLLEHGMVDMVVHRFELPAVLARLLDLMMHPVREAKAEEAERGQPAIPALPPPAPEQDLDALREAADD